MAFDLELAPTLLRCSTSPTAALRQASVAERPIALPPEKGSAIMADEFAQTESPAERYRRLAQECMTTAADLPFGEQREVLLQIAQVWQRLADQYANATTSLSQPSAGEQPVMQQQQQAQPKDDDKKE
jgi:hypothetical protein